MEEVFEPAKIQEFKVVGKIDLSSMNVTTHAGKGADHTPSADYIISIPTREEIEKKLSVWRPDWKALRKFVPALCYEYSDGYPLRVKLKSGETAYAIGCLDPLKQTAGYYIVINLYGQGVITKMGDKMMEDGVMAGEWNPETIQSVNKATSGERDIINSLLLPQIEKERELFRETLVQEFLELAEEQARRLEAERKEEEERLRKEAEQREREKQEALARIEEQRQQLIAEHDAEIDDDYPLSHPSEELLHLPFARRQKSLRYADWPRIDGEVSSERYFDGMKTLSYIIETAGPFPTYILSRAYMRKMVEMRDELMLNFISYRQLIGDGGRRRGALCYKVQDMDVTVVYDMIVPKGEPKEFLRFAIIDDDQLVLTYTFYRPNTAVQPYVTHTSLLTPLDPRFSKMKDICNRTIEKIIMHIMLEQQTEKHVGDDAESDIIMRTASQRP